MDEVAFATISVREPAGFTIEVDNHSPLCVTGEKVVRLGLYDTIGRDFSSLSGWSSEKLDEILNVRSSNFEVVTVRKMAVFSHGDAALVATVAIHAQAEGTALVSFGLPSVHPMYIPITVYSIDSCQQSYLRIPFTITSASPFQKSCSDIASQLLKHEVADLIGTVAVPSMRIESIDLDSGEVVLLIESDENEDLVKQLKQQYNMLAVKAGLGNSVPEMLWVTRASVSDSEPSPFCPASGQQTSRSTSTSRGGAWIGGKRTAFDQMRVWVMNLIIFLIILGLCTFTVRTLKRRYEEHRQRLAAELNADHGPSSYTFQDNSFGPASRQGNMYGRFGVRYDTDAYAHNTTELYG